MRKLFFLVFVCVLCGMQSAAQNAITLDNYEKVVDYVNCKYLYAYMDIESHNYWIEKLHVGDDFRSCSLSNLSNVPDFSGIKKGLKDLGKQDKKELERIAELIDSKKDEVKKLLEQGKSSEDILECLTSGLAVQGKFAPALGSVKNDFISFFDSVGNSAKDNKIELSEEAKTSNVADASDYRTGRQRGKCVSKNENAKEQKKTVKTTMAKKNDTYQEKSGGGFFKKLLKWIAAIVVVLSLVMAAVIFLKKEKEEKDNLNHNYNSLETDYLNLKRKYKNCEDDLERLKHEYGKLAEENSALRQELDKMSRRINAEIEMRSSGHHASSVRNVVVESAKSQKSNTHEVNDLYADAIIEDCFNSVIESPSDDMFFVLHLLSSQSASFEIFEGAKRRILANPAFLAGCEKQILDGASDVFTNEPGKAECQMDGRWKIVKKLSVILK